MRMFSSAKELILKKDMNNVSFVAYWWCVCVPSMAFFAM